MKFLYIYQKYYFHKTFQGLHETIIKSLALNFVIHYTNPLKNVLDHYFYCVNIFRDVLQSCDDVISFIRFIISEKL